MCLHFQQILVLLHDDILRAQDAKYELAQLAEAVAVLGEGEGLLPSDEDRSAGPRTLLPSVNVIYTRIHDPPHHESGALRIIGPFRVLYRNIK